MKKIITIQDTSDFKAKVENSDIPVFLKFTAEWCGPCKALDPVLENLSEKYSGKITFAKVDIDKNQDIAMKFKIRSIPTTVVVKNGKSSHLSTGMKGSDWYENLCTEIL